MKIPPYMLTPKWSGVVILPKDFHRVTHEMLKIWMDIRAPRERWAPKGTDEQEGNTPIGYFDGHYHWATPGRDYVAPPPPFWDEDLIDYILGKARKPIEDAISKVVPTFFRDVLKLPWPAWLVFLYDKKLRDELIHLIPLVTQLEGKSAGLIGRQEWVEEFQRAQVVCSIFAMAGMLSVRDQRRGHDERVKVEKARERRPRKGPNYLFNKLP